MYNSAVPTTSGFCRSLCSGTQGLTNHSSLNHPTPPPAPQPRAPDMTARSLCLLALTIGLCAPHVSAQQKKPATAPAGVAAPKGTALLVPAPVKRDPKIAAALADISADTMR